MKNTKNSLKKKNIFFLENLLIYWNFPKIKILKFVLKVNFGIHSLKIVFLFKIYWFFNKYLFSKKIYYRLSLTL